MLFVSIILSSSYRKAIICAVQRKILIAVKLTSQYSTIYDW